MDYAEPLYLFVGLGFGVCLKNFRCVIEVSWDRGLVIVFACLKFRGFAGSALPSVRLVFFLFSGRRSTKGTGRS